MHFSETVQKHALRRTFGKIKPLKEPLGGNAR